MTRGLGPLRHPCPDLCTPKAGKGRMPLAVRGLYKEQFWTLQPLHEKGIRES